MLYTFAVDSIDSHANKQQPRVRHAFRDRNDIAYFSFRIARRHWFGPYSIDNGFLYDVGGKHWYIACVVDMVRICSNRLPAMVCGMPLVYSAA